MIDFFPSRVIAIEIFGFSIHWYGLLYLCGFLLAYALLPRLQQYRGLHLSRDEWAELLSWAIVGVIVGGRLGYVFLYEPAHFLANPLQIPAVWRGGMSSHGGFIGVTLAMMYATRKRGISLLHLADVAVVPVAIALALGRLGNFINQELYGSITTLPWGMAIPGVDGLRHPTQIYALLKDLLIASVCFTHLRTPRSTTGSTLAIFLMLYAVLRFLVEFVRIPSHSSFDLGLFVLTRGQLYTIPIFLVGAGLWWWVRHRKMST